MIIAIFVAGLLYSVKGSDLMRHSIWGMEKRKRMCEEQAKKVKQLYVFTKIGL